MAARTGNDIGIAVLVHLGLKPAGIPRFRILERRRREQALVSHTGSATGAGMGGGSAWHAPPTFTYLELLDHLVVREGGVLGEALQDGLLVRHGCGCWLERRLELHQNGVPAQTQTPMRKTPRGRANQVAHAIYHCFADWLIRSCSSHNRMLAKRKPNPVAIRISNLPQTCDRSQVH